MPPQWERSETSSRLQVAKHILGLQQAACSMTTACCNGPTNPDYSACRQLPLPWEGGMLRVPPTEKTGAQVGRYKSAGWPLSSSGCQACGYEETLSRKACSGTKSAAAQMSTRKGQGEDVYRCGRGPQGRIDPRTKLEALPSSHSVGWTGKRAGSKGRSFQKRWMGDVLLRHHSHSHLPATDLEGVVNK